MTADAGFVMGFAAYVLTGGENADIIIRNDTITAAIKKRNRG